MHATVPRGVPLAWAACRASRTSSKVYTRNLPAAQASPGFLDDFTFSSYPVLPSRYVRNRALPAGFGRAERRSWSGRNLPEGKTLATLV